MLDEIVEGMAEIVVRRTRQGVARVKMSGICQFGNTIVQHRIPDDEG